MYPDSDGVPMGDGMLAVRWITALYLGFEAQYRNNPDVFVASNLIWYPVEGKPRTRAAPDLLVVFGRPKGNRMNYLQWNEGGGAPQVVLEVIGPSYTPAGRERSAAFCDRHGVEEFYEYDPAARVLLSRVRGRKTFGPATPTTSHASARLGVRFEVPVDRDLEVIRPDGTRFPRYSELVGERNPMHSRADELQQKADRLAAKLRELGIDPDAV